MKWILSFLLFVLFSPFSMAIVDMRNANYSETWTDLEIPGAGYDLRVVRTYNSRSLMNGIFGFGWCSEFETKLDITPEGNIKLTECGGGMEILYTPKNFSAKDLDKTIDNILAKVKQKEKAKSAEFFKELRLELINKVDKRIQMAAEYGVEADVKEGVVYLANGKEVENFVYQKGFFVRNLPDGTSMRFDQKGRLAFMYDKNKNFLKFNYKDKVLTDIVDNNSRKLNFKYQGKRISQISGPQGKQATYKFKNLDDLSWVKNAWGNVYTYEYDELHNMRQANWPDGTNIKIGYDVNKDWVTSFTDRNKCVESYKYESNPADKFNHYWSTVKKVCGKEVVNESRFEFIHKVRSDGVTYLHRTISNLNGVQWDILYDESFGKPLSIKKNNQITKYEYFPNGQVKVKDSGLTKSTFEYFPGAAGSGKSGKVKKVSSVFLNDKGKQIGTKVSEFNYDEKGNLTFAKNSDGQEIILTYDSKGRIETIKDQAKKLVKVQYDEKLSKPKTIIRPGLGTVVINYNQKGEIKKAESPDGPQVAVQVASTFNNYLDVIAPASNEIYN